MILQIVLAQPLEIPAKFRFGSAEGTIGGNSTNKCESYSYAWIDTELPQEPVRVGLLFSNFHGEFAGSQPEYNLQIRTF